MKRSLKRVVSLELSLCIAFCQGGGMTALGVSATQMDNYAAVFESEEENPFVTDIDDNVLSEENIFGQDNENLDDGIATPSDATALSNIANDIPAAISEEEFVIDENGVLKDYKGDSENVVIPDGVKEIGSEAFMANKRIISVKIPYGVTEIGESAFEFCGQLANVEMPDSLVSIGDNAFTSCSNLTDLYIPNSVENIGMSAFSSSNLSNVHLPENITYLDSIFYMCSSLESIEIPESVLVMDTTFSGCKNLKKVDMPENLLEIGDYTFHECESLEYIDIPKTVKKIGESAFFHCRKLQKVDIPEGVVSIENCTFQGSGLREISLPDSLECIKTDAFYGCDLTSINLPGHISEIDGFAFASTNITNVVWPSGVNVIKDETFSSCKQLKSIYIPAGVTSIRKMAFYDCDSLENIILPDGIEELNYLAFGTCDNLRTIVVPDSVTYFDSPFAWDDNLTIYCNPGSAAETYAKEHDYPYAYIRNTSSEGTVCIFNKYDENNKQISVSLNLGTSLYPILDNYNVTSATDMSFVDILDEIAGKPVLLKSDSAHNVLGIYPVDERKGTITGISATTITIDGTLYFLSSNQQMIGDLSDYLGKKCIVYVYDDIVAEKQLPEVKNGVLNGINTGENKIIIDNVEYPMDLQDISFLASIELWLDHTIQYEILAGTVYRVITEEYDTVIVRKLTSYDKQNNCVYFEDGSSNILVSDFKAELESLIGKWVICTLKTSIQEGICITDIAEMKSAVEVDIKIDKGTTVYCKNNKYSFDDAFYQDSSAFEIPFTITITNRLMGHGTEITKDMLASITDEQLNIKINQLKVEQPQGFNFDWSGKGEVKQPENLSLKLGDSWEGNGFLRPEIFWVPEWDTNVLLMCHVSAEGQTYDAETSFTVKNLDKNPVYSTSTRDAISKYIEKNITQELIPKPMGSLFSEEQRQQFNAILSLWLTVIQDPEISADTKKSLYNTYEETGTYSVSSSIIIPAVINTKQYKNLGVRNIKFTVKLNNLGELLNSSLKEITNNQLNGNFDAEFNTIRWEILNKNGLPAASTSGYLPVQATADLDGLKKTLDDAAAKAKDDFRKAIEDAYEEANLITMLKDDLIAEVVNGLGTGSLNASAALSPYVVSVIEETLAGIIWQDEPDYKGAVDRVYSDIKDRTSKKLYVRCPVDVYLYYGEKLIGIIENNQLNETYARRSVGSYMEMEGEDTKIAYLPDEDFSVKLVGTDSGSMDYIVEEYSGSEETAQLLRTVYFDNVPLKKGKTYTGDIKSGVGNEKTMYALHDDEKVIEADYDTSLGDEIVDQPPVNPENKEPEQPDNQKDPESNGSGSGGSGGGSGSGGRGGSSNKAQTNGTAGTNGLLSADLPPYVVKGIWNQLADSKWTFTDEKGTMYKNCWAAVYNPYANMTIGQQAFDWFYFDSNGYMLTGWFLDPSDQNYYYLNPFSDGTKGRMMLEWQVIDGKEYYFNPISDGTRGCMYKNQATPDGHYVGDDGAKVY